MGLIYLKKDMYEQAMAEFSKAAAFENARLEGSNSFIPAFNMGYIKEALEDIDATVTFYKKCGNFKPTLNRLQELDS